MPPATVAGLTVGSPDSRMALIAGPCVAESEALCMEVARHAAAVCERVGMPYVFKASFDKANRTSASGFRGPGMAEGLRILGAVKDALGVPICTDIHEPRQADQAATVADVLQIPAFLARQTDLLLAAAATGRCVNVKKGQFMAPWDMCHVVDKLESAGCRNILLTERGVSFGYNTLVVDLCALPIMRSLGYPVCMDATHAVQQPSAAGGKSGGRREHVAGLARAAAAMGIDALFLEIHPDPSAGLSDSATMLPMRELEPLLQKVVAIDALCRA